MRRRILLTPAFLLFCVCSRAAAQTPVPTPVPAPPPAQASAAIPVSAVVVDNSAALQGRWVWTTVIGGETYTGSLELSRDTATTWKARVLDRAAGEMAVTSVGVEGGKLKLALDARGAPALVIASLQADGTLAGAVEISGGEGTFSARRE